MHIHLQMCIALELYLNHFTIWYLSHILCVYRWKSLFSLDQIILDLHLEACCVIFFNTDTECPNKRLWNKATRLYYVVQSHISEMHFIVISFTKLLKFSEHAWNFAGSILNIIAYSCRKYEEIKFLWLS